MEDIFGFRATSCGHVDQLFRKLQRAEFNAKATVVFVEKKTINMAANHVFEAINRNMSLRGNQVNFLKKLSVCVYIP